jgi:hypothetical protein
LDEKTTMQLKSIPWWLGLIPIAFLLVATAQMSLGYYTVTRIVVFAAAAFLAFMSWNEGWIGRFGSGALAIVAVAFNPILPFPFTRETWVYLDYVCIAVFVAHIIFVRHRLKRSVLN